jgi:hypothetical protein
MRPGWVAAGILLLTAGAGAAERDAAVAGTVRHSSGRVQVTLHAPTGSAFEEPVFRLVALPPGASAPRLRLDAGSASVPDVTLGDPMTARGVRLVPVRVARGAGGDAGAGTLEFEISYSGGDPRARPARGFLDPLGDLVLGGDLLTGGVEGGYVVVTVPELVPTLDAFVDWKRETGRHVTVVTTDDAGTTNESIRAYLQALYAAAAVPPQYVLLVGDVEQIPGFDYHQSVSDLPYALLDGSDFLPDVEIGRFSARTAFELETIVAKTLRYEQDPDRTDEGWFSRALMVGGNMGSATPVPTSLWCRDQLLDQAVGYAQVDTVFYPPYDATGPYFIRPVIDAGVSIVSYRGWALGASGWDAPQFTVDEIPSLANGWMLPAVFSFVCLNGDYSSPECYGEAWIRAGTAAEPKGAVGFIGNSEHWSHTRYNDAAAIGAFDAIRAQGVRRLGQILDASKARILAEFPDRLHYDPWADESVEFYYYIYSLLGDPSLEIWTAPPRTITVEHADSILRGSTSLEVVVREADGTTPVRDARVGVSQGDTVLGCAFTDGDGLARVLATFEDDSTPVRVAVTGTGLGPYRVGLPVVAGELLALSQVAVDDDGGGGSSGNADGVCNPGEVLELVVTVQNRGANPASGITGTLEALGGATVLDGVASFPDLAGGASAAGATPFRVEIDAAAEDGLVPRFRLTLAAGADSSVAGFDLAVRAPDPRHEGSALDGDGVLDPGETAALTVTLVNEGSVSSGPASAVLRTVTPGLVAVVDSLADFGPAAPGAPVTQTSPFTVVASDTAAIGQAAVFALELTTDEGWRSGTSFSVVLGHVDHRAPVGPDAYGYYAYDNSDTDYPTAAPVYEWIPCSPAYGGSGTALALGDNTTTVVELPFPFTFYGQSFDSLLVSDNGWASFEIAPYFDFYNWSLPSTYGTGALLAPFWDNLDPTKEYQGVPVGDGVYTWYDAAGHRFVVEWSRLGNVRSQHQGENRPDWDELQTFELVLLDPAWHATPTGDGIVRFQYKQIVNNDDERMYSTVGIENAAEDAGIQYTFCNLYPAGAAPLSAGLVVDFSTVPPRYSPFRLVSFEAVPAGEGVALSWEPIDDRPLGGYRVYRQDPDGEVRLLPGGSLGPDARGFLDGTAVPGETHAYLLGAVDAVGRETRLGPFPVGGEAPVGIALENGGPNPSGGAVALTVTLPERTESMLRVYSVEGRLVRTLIRGAVDAGRWSVPWDGRDDHGRSVASGVYFVRLDAGEQHRSLKVARVR